MAVLQKLMTEKDKWVAIGDPNSNNSLRNQVSSLIVCNSSEVDTKISVALSDGDREPTDANLIIFEHAIAKGTTWYWTSTDGLILGHGRNLKVRVTEGEDGFKLTGTLCLVEG